MGLYDRGYVREDGGDMYDRRAGHLPGPAGWTMTTWLIAVNVAVFVLDIILYGRFSVGVPLIHGYLDGKALVQIEQFPPLFAYGHFSTTRAIGSFEIWRFVTYQFLHGGLMHILFNMFALWSFGRLVEERIGARRYLAFYILSGIGGSLLYLLLSIGGQMYQHRVPFFLPGFPTDTLVGASASIFGVLVASAYYAPNLIVSLIFPPVSMPLKVMVWIFIAIALLTVYADGNNSGGEAAHLGGAAVGYLLIRRIHLLNWVGGAGTKPARSTWRNARSPSPFSDDSQSADWWKQDTDSEKPARRGWFSRKTESAAPGGLSAHDLEVDRILAKVATEGLQSLSEKEKRVLREDTERKRRHA